MTNDPIPVQYKGGLLVNVSGGMLFIMLAACASLAKQLKATEDLQRTAYYPLYRTSCHSGVREDEGREGQDTRQRILIWGGHWGTLWGESRTGLNDGCVRHPLAVMK